MDQWIIRSQVLPRKHVLGDYFIYLKNIICDVLLQGCSSEAKWRWGFGIKTTNIQVLKIWSDSL